MEKPVRHGQSIYKSERSVAYTLHTAANVAFVACHLWLLVRYIAGICTMHYRVFIATHILWS